MSGMFARVYGAVNISSLNIILRLIIKGVNLYNIAASVLIVFTLPESLLPRLGCSFIFNYIPFIFLTNTVNCERPPPRLIFMLFYTTFTSCADEWRDCNVGFPPQTDMRQISPNMPIKYMCWWGRIWNLLEIYFTRCWIFRNPLIQLFKIFSCDLLLNLITIILWFYYHL